ncbi:MAG: aminotransferase class V-fold PLP-dependent enzyme [Phycisphaerales bacterium]
MPSPTLYLDNAATSFPKPRAVLAAMQHYATELGASPGRGSYRQSVESGKLIDLCRSRINTLIHGENPTHVIFTLNCTDALNMAIKGLVPLTSRGTSGGRRVHLITTELEHNSILRPFNQLVADHLATQTRVPVDPVTGLVDPDDIRKAITLDTALIALLHASNVTGTIQPIPEIGRIAREHDIPFLVDAAQSLGHVPIDVQAMNIDLLAAPGHKGLLGPLGTGILYIRPAIASRLRTFREGGTGSVSELDTQPDFLPDRFEAGSHNTLGIVGLSEGVQYLLDRTLADVHSHGQSLIKTMLESLTEWGAMPGFHLYGPPTVAAHAGVFSVRIDSVEPLELAAILETQYGILTRAGLHCAPGAHRTIGSLPHGGTTRFSFGHFTTLQDVKYAADALGQICHTLHDAPKV